jgi:prepilin-type N-terminal cleavage/methylation domain-containing protein
MSFSRTNGQVEMKEITKHECRMRKKGREVFTLIQFCRKFGRGTHAPSRAHFGASPKCSPTEKFAIARARSPAREARALPREETAFTLLELLVVIAIIAILLGLVFPVFQGVLDRAKKVQAKNDLTQIVTAVNAFYTEYGRYPITGASDAAATYGPGHLSTKAVFDELRAKNTSSTALNSRQIVFISPAEDTSQINPKGKVGSDGQFYDPWGFACSIGIDADYDNQITPNPYGANNGAGASPIRQGVIAWSLGKDGTLGKSGNYTNSDDVISWQ